MSDYQTTLQPGISAWIAEFLDPTTEAAYRKRNTRFNIRHARFGLGLWGVLLVFFIYGDYLNLGTDQGFWILLAMRLTVSMAIVIFSLKIGHNPGLIMNGHGIAFLLAFGWTGFFLVFFFLPQDQLPWTIGVVMIMLISQYVFIPNRVVTSTMIALYAMAGSLVCVHWTAGTGPAKLAALLLILLVPSATGLFVCHRFQFEHRRAFAMLLAAETANEKLKREIRARRKLEIRLKRQATIDPLTGLYNRRQYEALFNRELGRIQRFGGRLSGMVLDLDYFKQINDTHGHNAGDAALKEVAALCRRQLRQVDITGRLGGEEFVMILPDTDLSEAMAVAQRLRESIGDLEIKAGQSRFHLTATIGVAELAKEDQSINDLVRRADEAMYRGKLAGRNRVEANKV